MQLRGKQLFLPRFTAAASFEMEPATKVRADRRHAIRIFFSRPDYIRGLVRIDEARGDEVPSLLVVSHWRGSKQEKERGTSPSFDYSHS